VSQPILKYGPAGPRKYTKYDRKSQALKWIPNTLTPSYRATFVSRSIHFELWRDANVVTDLVIFHSFYGRSSTTSSPLSKSKYTTFACVNNWDLHEPTASAIRSRNHNHYTMWEMCDLEVTPDLPKHDSQKLPSSRLTQIWWVWVLFWMYKVQISIETTTFFVNFLSPQAQYL
jgi:hypothetical protein